MKVLLINGSPRPKGCTYTALSEISARLENHGIETELFQLGAQPIRGCTACRKCTGGSHRCVFDDGNVNVALEKMEQSDGLIIGSPVYFASANGALTAFLDRMFFAGDCFFCKPAAAVVSARRAGTTATLDQLNKYFTIKNMPVVPSRYWNMVHGSSPEEVRQDLEGLQTMRILADNMAWMLNCFSAGRKAGFLPPTLPDPMVFTNFIR